MGWRHLHCYHLKIQADEDCVISRCLLLTAMTYLRPVSRANMQGSMSFVMVMRKLIWDMQYQRVEIQFLSFLYRRRRSSLVLHRSHEP